MPCKRLPLLFATTVPRTVRKLAGLPSLPLLPWEGIPTLVTDSDGSTPLLPE